MTATPRIIVTDLDVLLPAEAAGAPAAALPASALEQLGRAQHAGARLYLLTPPLVRSDGADLDDLLARCERVARQLQDSGSRLEGALLPELGDDATAATAAELRELCRRLQCEADSLELVAASSAIRDAASHLGVARVHAATADAPFPHLGMA
jgi:hypothetical protein